MSLLLSDGIVSRISQIPFIIGIVLFVVGIVFIGCSGVITKAVRKTDKIEKGDKLCLGIRVGSLLMIILSLVLMII